MLTLKLDCNETNLLLLSGLVKKKKKVVIVRPWKHLSGLFTKTSLKKQNSVCKLNKMDAASQQIHFSLFITHSSEYNWWISTLLVLLLQQTDSINPNISLFETCLYLGAESLNQSHSCFCCNLIFSTRAFNITVTTLTQTPVETDRPARNAFIAFILVHSLWHLEM